VYAWLGFALFVSLLLYIIPFCVQAYVLPEQDLKKRYNSTWAVVTGASSGIGRAIVDKLALQGINVVMVALDDQLFSDVFATMQKTYSNVRFRKVGVNLGGPGYEKAIEATCADIEPNLIFNNAGFVATGHFADSPLDRQLANYECNATAPVKITHLFLNKMLDRKQKGAVFFTSSPAGLLPCPMTVMYGATKAFLTEFAVSVAAEVRGDGIDVLVVHPSPVDTNFYAGNKHNIDAMKFFQKTATSPTAIAKCFFQSIGYAVVHDQGYFSLLARIGLKLVDHNLMSNLASRTASMSADFKKSKKPRDGGRKLN